jgi:hypothetical protein
LTDEYELKIFTPYLSTFLNIKERQYFLYSSISRTSSLFRKTSILFQIYAKIAFSSITTLSYFFALNSQANVIIVNLLSCSKTKLSPAKTIDLYFKGRTISQDLFNIQKSLFF